MIVLILFALFLLLLLVFCYYFTNPPGTKELSEFEGPPTQWVFGNVLQFPMNLADMTAIVQKWWQTYKSPMKVKFMHKWSIHLYKAEHVEALLKDLENITKSRDYEMVQDWLGTGLLTSTGDKWRYRRKLLTPAFHYQILKDFVPIFNEQAEVVVDVLKDCIKKTETIDICPLMTRLTLDVICETAMGKKINAQRDMNCEYAAAVNEFSEAIIQRAMRPWLWIKLVWNLTPQGRNYNRAIKKMHAFTRKIIREREQNPAGDANGKRRLAFLDLLLQMKNNGQLSDEDIREEVDTFMFEGHDTTATGLTWILYCIGLHPDIQEQLFEEISAVCSQHDHVTSEQLADMNLLDRVVKEAFRLYPPVPMIVRKLTHPFAIEGTNIPIGTTVNIVQMALHLDAEVFPDPLKFDPDRFLPDAVEHRHPFAYVPFSAGPRNCIGQKFALIEEKVVLVHLIKNFIIESVQKPEDIRTCIQLVLRPADGIWLRLRKR